MNKPILTALLITAGSLLAGCGAHPYFDDDEAATHDESLFTTSDHLSQPYATGATVRVSYYDKQVSSGWQLVSDDPTIFAVDEQQIGQGALNATGHALSEGTTTLRAMANGAKHHHTSIVVKTANKARMFALAAARINGLDEAGLAQAEVGAATVLVGGKATFAIAYYRDGERVYGHNLLSVDAPASVAIKTDTTSTSPATEWLIATPSAVGDVTLNLKQGGTTLAALALDVVDESAITSVALVEETHGKLAKDESVWVYAKPTDSAGHPVLGAYFDWTLDGVAQLDDEKHARPGDLYRYSADPKAAPRTLVATGHGLNASIAIRSKEGYVSDTTYLGCSAGGAPGESLMMLAFVMVALAFAHRNATRMRRAAGRVR